MKTKFKSYEIIINFLCMFKKQNMKDKIHGNEDKKYDNKMNKTLKK